MSDTVLGTFSGIDNVHDSASKFLSPSKEGLSVVEASNLSFSDEGYAVAVPSPQLVRDDNYKQILFSDAGLLARNGDSLELNPHTTRQIIIDQLNEDLDVTVHEHAGQLFWFNSEEAGRIQNTVAKNWGMLVPVAPLLTQTTGVLPAGRYMVALTYVDGNGVESAADESSLITLGEDQNIVVDHLVSDPNAVEVKVWCSRADGSTLFYAGSALAAEFPITISDIGLSAEPLRTQFMLPPIRGNGMFSYRGFLIIYSADYLFISDGPNPHLFDPNTVEQRPSTIIAGGGLDGGFWTVCEQGAFWTAGDSPASWHTVQVNNLHYAKGSIIIDGNLIPILKTEKPVIIFLSNKGLVAGLQDGNTVLLTKDKVEFDVANKNVFFTNSSRELFCTILEV